MSVFAMAGYFVLLHCMSVFWAHCIASETGGLEVLAADCKKLPAPGNTIVLSNKSNNKVDYEVIFKSEKLEWKKWSWKIKGVL